MDLDDLYRLLRGAHVQAQGIVDTVRDPLLVMDEDLCILSANPAFYRTFATGRDDSLGKRFEQLGDGQWQIAELQFLLEKVIPKSSAILDYEVTAEFPKIGPRTMLVSAQRLVHPEDGRRLLLLSIVDATEQRGKDNEKDLLIGEVRHRVKNLLAVTRALAKQTSVAGRTAEQYRDTFLGRFGALARALEVTIDRSSSDLPDLAKAVLEPYAGDGQTIKIDNAPVVPLQARQAMSLGMILHELATNALKYGALSAQGGQVALSWTTGKEQDGLEQVHMQWTESGGPAPVSPSQKGFGTRLIRSAAERELGGKVDLEFRPGGLVVSQSFPLRAQ